MSKNKITVKHTGKLELNNKQKIMYKLGLEPVNRLEIIDHTKEIEDGGGRTVIFFDENKKAEGLFQDGNHTLKIFITWKGHHESEV